MSTQATIIYDEKSGVHIYHEYLDGYVYLEIEREGFIELNVKLMPFQQWIELIIASLSPGYMVHT